MKCLFNVALLLCFFQSFVYGEFFPDFEFNDSLTLLKEWHVIQLDNSFWPNVDTEFWLVACYSDQCTHCKDFLPAYERLSSEMKDYQHLKFGRVFCPTAGSLKKTPLKKTPGHSKTGMYNQKFFDWQVCGSLRSAQEMIPTVINITHPRSVCDVGCGTGAWLKTAQEVAGLSDDDTAGFDFDVPVESLLIKASQYRNVNLSIPVEHQRQFDLCISMEVAEHLSELSADTFVKSLVSLAPVILFSAAIPCQGGKHHVNEQFLNYWEARFKEHHYYGVDYLRGKFWNNNNVEVWYRQNSVLFVREDKLKTLGLKLSNGPLFSVVHPEIWHNNCRKNRKMSNFDVSDHSTLSENVSQSPLCSAAEIQRDPVIKLLGHGNIISYTGKLDSVLLSKWISESITLMENGSKGANKNPHKSSSSQESTDAGSTQQSAKEGEL